MKKPKKPLPPSFKYTAYLTLGMVLLQIVQSCVPEFMVMQIFTTRFLYPLNQLPFFFLTLITHMFSHGGWAHLLGNLSIGLPCMAYVEHKVGGPRMLLFFVICGLAAAATQALMPLTGLIGMIGASGALFGLLACSCAMFGTTTPTRTVGYLTLAIWMIPQLGALSLSLLGSGVAVAAHLGGAICGLILASYAKTLK